MSAAEEELITLAGEFTHALERAELLRVRLRYVRAKQCLDAPPGPLPPLPPEVADALARTWRPNRSDS